MAEEQYFKIIKTLASADHQPLGAESLSEIASNLGATRRSFFREVTEGSEGLVLFIKVKKGELIARLGQFDRDQIGLLTAIFTMTNTKKAELLSPEVLTAKINKAIADGKMSFSIPANPNLLGIIKRVKGLEKVLRCVRLITKQETISDILPYTRRYVVMPVDQIEAELDQLENEINDVKLKLPIDEEVRKSAIPKLQAMGHPLVELKSKDAGSLLDILVKHFIAGLGTFYAKGKAQQKSLSQSDIIDSIGLFLLDEEDARQTD